MSGRRLSACLFSALLAVTLLAGCGDSTTSNAATTDGPAFPITLEHVHGSTTIDEEPARVVALASADQDAALALGVVPVGAARQTVGGTPGGSTPWFEAKLKEVGGEAPELLNLDEGVDVAAVEQLDPDLILSTGRELTEDDYDQLSEIAPVVAGDPDGLSWRSSLEAAGGALGRSAEAAKVTSETESVIDEGAADQQGMSGTTFILAHLYPGEYDAIGVRTPRDPRVSLLNDFGLVNPDVVEELATGDEEIVRIEAADVETLKSEILLLLPARPKEVIALESSLQMSRIPALNSGRAYAELNKTLHLALAQPSTLAIPRVIVKYLPDVALIADF